MQPNNSVDNKNYIRSQLSGVVQLVTIAIVLILVTVLAKAYLDERQQHRQLSRENANKEHIIDEVQKNRQALQESSDRRDEELVKLRADVEKLLKSRCK